MIVVVHEYYTVSRAGKTLREVTCEQCGQDYVYMLHVKIEIRDGTLEGAVSMAERVRALRLNEGIDVAPCPACGWIQKQMYAKARTGTDYLFAFGLGGVCLCGIGLYAVLLSPEAKLRPAKPQDVQILLWILIPCLLITVWRTIVGLTWHPNRQPVEKRLTAAAKISMKRQDYEEMLEREGRKFTDVFGKHFNLD